MADNSESRIMLGHITGVSGLKGWVKVHSDTSPRENIVTYRHWWVEKGGHWQQVSVLEGRPQGKTIVASIEGVSDPEAARGLIGSRIAVDRSQLPALPGGEFYWADLIGMQVRTVDGQPVGPVDRLFETGANDVLVVTDTRVSDAASSAAEVVADNRATKGSSVREVLVPWLVPDIITEIDMDSRVITIDWDPDF